MQASDEALCLAGLVLEVAEHMPDNDNDITRAEWRWKVVQKAIEIGKARNITIGTDDLDEEVTCHFAIENTYS